MLLRLLAGLLGRRRGVAETDAAPGRGTVVSRDGAARPAVRLRVADGSPRGDIPVEAHPELRSAALLHSHYLPDVSPAMLFEMHRSYGGRWADEVPPDERVVHRVFSADADRRIRIGYVSPNFSQHSVSYLIEPVLENHDRTAFEVYAYHTAETRDGTTRRIEAAVDVWRQVDELSDSALAKLVAGDRIDVLVDLAGHTLGGRIGVFARRPAPVQMTWLGYPDTTGVQEIDYRITDAIADPAPGADARHTERLVRLPGAFLCYRPPADAPDVAHRDASRDEIVFCSFNTLEKVNERVIELWSRVLREVPRSLLLLKSGLLAQPAVAQRVRDAFGAHGIAGTRLELQGWAEDTAQHLARYGRADIALDTWPYNGTITTCEAMWMGVPVVTLAGEAHMSRVGATLLGAVGLTELIAHSADDFVAAAVALARDAQRRREIHATLRGRMAGSRLLDHASFTRDLEGAIRGAWLAWCARPRS